MSGFQRQVNIQPAPAVAGDFASANPRASVLAGPSDLVTGPNGLTCGRFAWVDPTWQFASNTGNGAPAGFVHRIFGEAMITTFLSQISNVIPAGFECTLHQAGDFWAVNDGAGNAIPNQKVYAAYADGRCTTAATGTPPAGASTTASVAAATAAVTASIAPTLYYGGAGASNSATMTVTAVGSGSLVVGGILSGTNVVTGTSIVSQVSGTPGGIGVYLVEPVQTVASTAVAETYGIMTVTATTLGALTVGSVIAGANVTAGSVITGFGTGTGGLGTYNVSPTQTAASATVTAAGGIETKWYCMSFAAPGELMKISSWPIG